MPDHIHELPTPQKRQGGAHLAGHTVDYGKTRCGLSGCCCGIMDPNNHPDAGGQLAELSSWENDDGQPHSCRADSFKRSPAYLATTAGSSSCKTTWFDAVALPTGHRQNHSGTDCFMFLDDWRDAAIERGKTLSALERDPWYFDIACRRIEQAHKQRARCSRQSQHRNRCRWGLTHDPFFHPHPGQQVPTSQ